MITLSAEESSAWSGARGRISESLLRDLVPDLTTVPIYVCGPDSMMSATRTMLLGMNVPDHSILTEAFVSPLNSLNETEPAPRTASDDDHERPPPASRTVRVYTLGLQKRGASVDMTGDQTVLEAAEEAGHDLPFECRSGVCGQCKVKLLRGNVTMDAQDALTADDRARGIILACQARPTEDLELDA
jgi:ferredoxin